MKTPRQHNGVNSGTSKQKTTKPKTTSKRLQKSSIPSKVVVATQEAKPKRKYTRKSKITITKIPTPALDLASVASLEDEHSLHMTSSCFRLPSKSLETLVLDPAPTPATERIVYLKPDSPTESPFFQRPEPKTERHQLESLIKETQTRLDKLEKAAMGTKPIMPKLPMINAFSGNSTEDFDLFQHDLTNLVNRQPYSEDQKMQILESYLSGDARYTFQALPSSKKCGFADSILSLKQIFACTNMHEWLDKLDQFKHEPSEDYRVYAAKLTRMVNNAYPIKEMTSMAIESIKVSHFLKGINPDLAEMVRRRQPRLLDNATELAKIHEVGWTVVSKAQKRKLPNETEANESKQLMLLTNKDDSTKDEANYSGSNQRIVKYNDETKKALNQVIHEVKNTNKQNGQKLGDFKKKIEDLEDKLKSTEESLNFMQNKYHKQQKESSQRPYSESNSRIQSFGGRPDSRYKIDRNETRNRFACFNCQSPNHTVRDCPKRKQYTSYTHHHHHHGYGQNDKNQMSLN